jgi:hypothetical protein
MTELPLSRSNAEILDALVRDPASPPTRKRWLCPVAL